MDVSDNCKANKKRRTHYGPHWNEKAIVNNRITVGFFTNA
jgi:hypothetical protein